MKKINAAIMSFGMAGQVFHGPLLEANPSINLKYIAQRSTDTAKKFYPNVEIIKDSETIYHKSDIDLVVVNSPDHTHFEYAKKALLAGKHVVVEKPFVMRVEDGEELIKLAHEMNLVLSVFQNRRWDGDFLTVKNLIESQTLGRLIDYISHFDRYRPYLNDRVWREAGTGGTGNIFNLGSHLIDQALAVFGKPEAVFASIQANREDSKIDDYNDIRLIYPNVNVTLKSSLLTTEPGPRFILHGSHGSYIKRGVDPQEQALKDGVIPGTKAWGEEPENDWGILHTVHNNEHQVKKLQTMAGDYPAYYQNIFEAITTGKDLAVKPEESLLGIKVIEAAIESSKKLEVVRL